MSTLEQLESEVPPVVKDLAEAASTAARVLNRYWLALVVASLLFVLPRPAAANLEDAVKLPFGLGEILPGYFTVVAGLILSTLTVAFCAAHAQIHRVQRLVYRVLDAVALDDTRGALHPVDLFDAIRLPSLSRVAPLAQIARGRYQFFGDCSQCPRWLVIVTAIYYILLKLFTVIVFFGVPALAIVYVAWQHSNAVRPNNLPGWFPWAWVVVLVWIFLAVATIVLIQTVVTDVVHQIVALKKIARKRTI